MVAITDQLPKTVYFEIQIESFDAKLWREVQTVQREEWVNEMLDIWKVKWADRTFRVVEVTTTRKVHSA